MAKRYWVALVKIKNQNLFQKYVDLTGTTVKLYGGNF
jgi:uncharacterized protein (DUF1330 family)